ncbi:hypothetical protein [Nocardia abscessus]|uniref:hypothetical protein n=1 Tax=Nocardia abscessus TaxID=120957 RepID=UPI0002E69976|nr:hypothetical protein [Nocardia abscessus]MCC3330982.1 hypothetical protein [Nocardia abscessus]
MLADPRLIVEQPHDVIMDLAGDVRRADAEHVADHLRDSGIAARYLRRRILTRDRASPLTRLCTGELRAPVGVNLLREGLALPEVLLGAGRHVPRCAHACTYCFSPLRPPDFGFDIGDDFSTQIIKTSPGPSREKVCAHAVYGSPLPQTRQPKTDAPATRGRRRSANR